MDDYRKYETEMLGGATPSDVQQRVEDMNVGWRNYLTQAMGMDTDTFQVAQGTLGLQTSDSSGLFRMANGVPPYSSVAMYDASANSTRYDSYGLFLNALLPTTSSGMQSALGPKYAAWVAFKQANYTKFTTVMKMFESFAMGNLNATQTTAGKTVLKQADNDQLNKALDDYMNDANKTQFVDDAGNSYTLPTYSGTITTAKTAINNGASVSIDFSTDSMDTSSSSTTISGGASGFYDIFSGGAGGSYTALDSKATSSSFSVKGKIGQYATLPTEAQGWYNGSEVTRGYNAKKDYTVWDANSNTGSWDTFFDEQTGTLARRVSQLLLVTDVDITVTSHASYRESDLTTIKSQASFGIWPFFSASASATHTSSYTLNADGSLSYNYVLDKGKIAIWGVNVQPAPR